MSIMLFKPSNLPGLPSSPPFEIPPTNSTARSDPNLSSTSTSSSLITTVSHTTFGITTNAPTGSQLTSSISGSLGSPTQSDTITTLLGKSAIVASTTPAPAITVANISEGSSSTLSPSSTILLPNSTTLPSSTTSLAHSKKSAIKPGVIAAVTVCGVLLIIAGLFFLRRYYRNRRTRAPSSTFQGDMMFRSPQPTPLFRANSSVGGHLPLVGSTPRSAQEDHWEENASNAPLSRIGTPILIPGTPSKYPNEKGFDTLPSRPGLDYSRSIVRTDRQMMLEEKIFGLKMRMISLSDNLESKEHTSVDPNREQEIQDIKAKIVRLEALKKNSEWALERTDEVPKDLVSVL